MTIGFIGGGNMASALISGFMSSGKVSADNIIVFDTDAEKLSAMAENMGISPASSASDTECRADIIVLAVKPNVMPFVLKELSGTDGKIYVSIAAGITLDTLEGGIGSGKKIIRTMPNTPALVGCGITVITPNKNIAPDELSTVEELFKAVGETVILDEKYINPAIALHSSSPAYIYMLIDAMADGGVKYGIPKTLALKLVAKAVEGSARMVLETGEHPEKLKDNVCSPGGTTIAAVCELERCGFKSSVQSAIDACVYKANNM